MTVTIAARWRVTLRVQSLARVTMPPPPPAPARTHTVKPDLHRLADARRLHAELEEERHHWETNALFSIRRMC